MFNKNEFSNILKKIGDTYSSQTEFSKKSKIGRTYISQYINKKIDFPPKPSILKKIADSSNGITNYEILMETCGYISNDKTIRKISNSLSAQPNDNFFTVPLLTSQQEKLVNTNTDITLYDTIDTSKQYFGYIATTDEMAPLLDIGDIAIVQRIKDNTFYDKGTYLIKYEKNIIIRKIIDNKNDTVDFIAMNPYYKTITVSINQFEIFGEILEAHNSSAFKKKG